MKRVVYFYEGETEKALLFYLKKSKLIKAGKLKKHNLWKSKFKLQRTINKKDKIFFVIDIDNIANKDIFIKNIKSLKSYNICLIVQNKNLEDELRFSCDKANNKALFKSFYNTIHIDEFKKNFAQEKNLANKLENNNFIFKKLWSRANVFSDFIQSNQIQANIDCRYQE